MSVIPTAVSPEEWQRSHQSLLAEEKAATRAADALAARRRRMPVMRVDKGYSLAGPDGPTTLLGLFEGRRQLILYHFMYGPDWEAGCVGCPSFIDTVTGGLAHLRQRDTTFALVSRAPLAQLQAYGARMGWDVPWYSSLDSDFNFDFAVSSETSETFGLSVFIRDGEDIYRSYFTNRRGVERLGSHWTLLDLTPLGRQETWEDSPTGWPQSEPYTWWQRHDEYTH
jgi:predicted dithiol-disulfide oxidoreductase (DUF899 family)